MDVPGIMELIIDDMAGSGSMIYEGWLATWVIPAYIHMMVGAFRLRIFTRMGGNPKSIRSLTSACGNYKRGSRYKNESEVFLRLLQAVQGKVTDVLYREGRAAFLEFNPKFDFNSPPKATARPGSAPVRLAPELTSLVEALTLVENGATEYRSNLLVFLIAAQKVLEANFIKTDQILDRTTGYQQLSQVARSAGRRHPAVFFQIVLCDLPPSPHKQLLQSYLLMNLALGMSSAE